MVKIEYVDYEDLEAPLVLYKYRDWSNPFHKKVLVEPSIYLAAPSDFEDPLDCKTPIRYDLLADYELFDNYLNESKRLNKHFNTFQKHLDWAGSWFLKSPINDPKRLKEIDDAATKGYDERIGILSLTEDPLNILMWDKYSNHLKGFCVGYNSHLLFRFLGGGRIVEYCKELPIIKPFEEPFSVHFKRVYHKEDKWSFEKEYRTHKFWPDRASEKERNVRISKECIVEVIFGPNISAEHKQEIENIIKLKLPKVKLIETKLETEIKFCT